MLDAETQAALDKVAEKMQGHCAAQVKEFRETLGNIDKQLFEDGKIFTANDKDIQYLIRKDRQQNGTINKIFVSLELLKDDINELKIAEARGKIIVSILVVLSNMIMGGIVHQLLVNFLSTAAP